MKKFQCRKCGHKHIIESEDQPTYCVFTRGSEADWREVKKPAAEAFPNKLTPAVFDLPECPRWARYAAVDKDGHAHWFGGVPNRGLRQDSEKWYHHETTMVLIPGRWDATNYADSIVTRAANQERVEALGGENTLVFRNEVYEAIDQPKTAAGVRFCEWCDLNELRVLDPDNCCPIIGVVSCRGAHRPDKRDVVYKNVSKASDVPSWCVVGSWVMANDGPSKGDIRQVAAIHEWDGSAWVDFCPHGKGPAGINLATGKNRISQVFTKAWTGETAPVALKVLFNGTELRVGELINHEKFGWGFVFARGRCAQFVSFEGLLKHYAQFPSGLPCGRYSLESFEEGV